MEQDHKYDYIQNPCYGEEKGKRDLPTYVSAPPQKSSKRSFSTVSSVMTCLNVLLAVISVGVAIFAVINSNTQQSQLMEDEMDPATDMQTSVRELFENASATQSQLMMLSEDIHRVAAMHLDMNEVVDQIRCASIGQPGQISS